MRKITKRLLTAGIAVLVLGACQDSVMVVQPVPPPPPPPPPTVPTVDATVSILGMKTIPGQASVNPTAVSGDINVQLNINENDDTVTGIDLLLDGSVIGCQRISANTVSGGDARLSEVSAADVVECFFNTDDVQGSCVGAQIDPLFDNGTHTLGARITLGDGETRDALNETQITLVNGGFLMLVHNEGSQSVVTGGVLYYGGPADSNGDGTDDNLNSFSVCPVSYMGTTVASLGLAGSTFAGQLAVDVGGGASGTNIGSTATDAATPFEFDADPTDNDLVSGNPVEDDVGTNGILAGHTIASAGTILDDSGLNVTSQFAPAALANIFLDFTSPQPNMGGASEVLVAGISSVLTWYSAGAFSLSFVTEAGVGWSFGGGTSVDMGECATTANNDGLPATAFVPEQTTTGIADHAEDDWEVGGDGFGGKKDAGGLDCFLSELQVLADDLGNAFALDSLGTTIQTATNYGSDQTAAGTAKAMPDPSVQPYVLNPDNENDGVIDIVDDYLLFFDAADVKLASGDPGSATDEAGCGGADGEGGLAQGCTAIIAAVNSGPKGSPATVPVGNNATLSTDKGGADDDFLVDLGHSIAPLTDGSYEIEVTVPDLATPANDATVTFTFELDNTPPMIGALNPAPVGSPGTDASAIIISIGETVADAHILDAVTLTLMVNGTDAMGADASASCSAAALEENLYTLSDTEVDRNAISLENGTNAVDFSAAAAEAFQVKDPFEAGVGGTVNYCFVIDAKDEALDVTGKDAPNVAQLVTQVDVTWNR